MQYHILNGDALYQQIPSDKIEGNFIICRECLIDGPLSGNSLIEFWDNRANFIDKLEGVRKGDYNEKVLPQFQRVLEIPPKTPVNLWFGDDLFCHINLCFILYLLDMTGHRANVFLVKASLDNWQEFGGMSAEALVDAYQNKQAITPEAFKLMLDCWTAFQQQDLVQLTQLSKKSTTNFPKFSEVIQAHIDRFPKNGGLGRPQQSLLAIKTALQTDDFGKIFQVFKEKEGIYGFGDLQVKAMLDEE